MTSALVKIKISYGFIFPFYFHVVLLCFLIFYLFHQNYVTQCLFFYLDGLYINEIEVLLFFITKKDSFSINTYANPDSLNSRSST